MENIIKKVTIRLAGMTGLVLFLGLFHSCTNEEVETTGTALYERQDDWSSATFWYESVPSAPLPEFPDLKSRVADL